MIIRWITRLGLLAVVAPAVSAQKRFDVVLISVPSTECRSRPDSSAAVVRRQAFSDEVEFMVDSATAQGRWTQIKPVASLYLKDLCWVPRDAIALAVHGDESSLRIAVADKVLNAKSQRFVDYVAAENLLIQSRNVLRASGPMQFRRLQLIAKAESVRDALKPSTLETAWRLAHDEYLEQSPFDVASTPRAKPYWDLFAAHRTEAWADEVAWRASMLRPDTDECYSECVLNVGIVDGLMRYWSQLPNGRFVDSALTKGAEFARYAAEMACSDGKGPSADTYFSPKTAAVIRNSLAAVNSPLKTRLLEHLATGEAKCRP